MCAATRAKCHVCGKIGHYAKVCRQKNRQRQPVERDASEIANETNTSSIDSMFIGSIESSDSNSSVKKIKDECDENDVRGRPWIVDIDIRGERC